MLANFTTKLFFTLNLRNRFLSLWYSISLLRLVFSFSIAACVLRHTSKPGPNLDSNPDSDSKKMRTREKHKPGLEQNPDSSLKKPGFDF
jgi:hypothetical protein